MSSHLCLHANPCLDLKMLAIAVPGIWCFSNSPPRHGKGRPAGVWYEWLVGWARYSGLAIRERPWLGRSWRNSSYFWRDQPHKGAQSCYVKLFIRIDLSTSIHYCTSVKVCMLPSALVQISVATNSPTFKSGSNACQQRLLSPCKILAIIYFF